MSVIDTYKLEESKLIYNILKSNNWTIDFGYYIYKKFNLKKPKKPRKPINTNSSNSPNSPNSPGNTNSPKKREYINEIEVDYKNKTYNAAYFRYLEKNDDYSTHFL